MPIPLPSRPARCRPDSGTKADRRTLLRRRVRGGLGLDFRRPHPTSLFTRLIGHLSQGDHPTTPRAVRQEQPWTCIGIPWMYTVLGPVSRAKRGCSSVVERHVANVNVVSSNLITRSSDPTQKRVGSCHSQTHQTQLVILRSGFRPSLWCDTPRGYGSSRLQSSMTPRGFSGMRRGCARDAHPTRPKCPRDIENGVENGFDLGGSRLRGMRGGCASFNSCLSM